MTTVLVVGQGGREHALASRIAESPRCSRLLVAPGNPGMPGERLPIDVDDVAALRDACISNAVDFVVVGPEASLAAGITDALQGIGVAVFGPTNELARLESSKAYARDLAGRLGIPSPRFATFATNDEDAAIAWWRSIGRVVVKQSGLAAGKGVVVPDTDEQTEHAIRDAIRLGEVVLEERLLGTECSLIALCDGVTAVALPLAQDHKRVGEGDVGANTGGMGAYAPAPVAADPDDLLDRFIIPVIDHYAAAGTPYVGALYAGIMLTDDGPRLLEYNCRFGDPEAQVLLPLIDGDVLEILLAASQGALRSTPVHFKDAHALGVVMASAGYPATATRGCPISGIDADEPFTHVFHSGTDLEGDQLITSGGRVLTCVGVGATLADARQRAYDAVARVRFDGAHFRRDIGWRASGAMIHSYAATGVNIDEGNKAVDLIKDSVGSTTTDSVLRGVGAFGGTIDVSFLKEFDHPVLVGSTDGVGTKVELAARTKRLRGVGHDIVNHCVNDVLVQRAFPLFFLDYLAASTIDAHHVAEVVGGMADACRDSGCVLLGGETAEMPGVYHDGAFDIAGTLVGVGERDELLPRADIASGDLLVGIASNGAHTNGYSYLRSLFAWIPLDAQPEPLDVPLVDALLVPHRNYLPVLRNALDTDHVKALVHVTGGGLPENLPRVLPPGIGADVTLDSWTMPPLFQLVRQLSSLDTTELYRTLNMGIGMVVVVDQEHVDAMRTAIDEETWVIGSLTDQHEGVRLT
jgi:phosphoribosylamine--glycine ligase/phosphoribosylformylglycinamidine cyclo-ligase